MRIILELEKGVDQNAASYFEKAKSLKKKILGINKALAQAENRLEKATTQEVERKELQKNKEKEKMRKKEWFEKFRWFTSSDGFLCIGGKDSGTNEIVIKKHTDPNDLVYHTEVSGSPFFVIKNPDGKEIPETTKKEAATACLTYSKIWSAGIKSAEVYEIKPEQVSKEAKSGEYLVKGAFMIYGKRNYYDPIVSLAIGLKDGIVMSGPLSAVIKNCEKIIKLRQGDLKKGEIAKTIMKKLGLHINDDIISCLPAGKFGFEKT